MSVESGKANALQRYCDAFVSLKAGSVEQLSELLADEVVFSDPFNNTVGRDRMLAIFEHMFQTLDNARFEILDTAAGSSASYIRWRLHGKTKNKGTVLVLDGMSEVKISPQGLITAHIDHWDSLSQLFAKLPVVGWIAKRVLGVLKTK